MIANINSPMMASMIDNHIMAESPYCEDVPNDTAQCAHCGNLIDKNDTYFSVGGYEYCSECDHRARSVVDDFIADLLGRHVSDEALDAIMDDCEQVW